MLDFIQNQILGMQWLSEIIKDLLIALHVDITSRMGGSFHFFLYDTIKILILLSVLIFIISYIQSYFPPERTKRILGKYRGIWANSLSALLGTATPFCSCSSIPLFIGFTNAGLPLGVTFSFLISSPLVDLGSLILLSSVFGFQIALAYVVVGLILAVAGGTLIEKLRMECYIEDLTATAPCCCSQNETQAIMHKETTATPFQIAPIVQQNPIDVDPSLTMKQRTQYAYEQVMLTVKQVFWYIIVGVSIGALIHNWIPSIWVQNILGDGNPFSVIIATFVGIPMYADIFGTIPIAEALFAKGVGIGTVLSFMMAVTALSVPSMIMIKKVLKPRLFILFVSIVILGIIFIGYAFNAFQFLFI